MIAASAVHAPFLSGLLLGASLIIAIGAQNAFVLRQGLLQAHRFPVALFCALSDAVLIAAGVGGLGAAVGQHPRLLMVVACAGALVLARVDRLVYGAVDDKAGAVVSLWDVVRDRRLNHRPEVIGGVLAEQCADLLLTFFGERRDGSAGPVG